MSQEVGQTELKEKTQQLLDGPLKHIRAAAIAAALLPLASVAATPAAAATTQCASGGVCGIVFNDANNNGIQDAGEAGVEGVKISVCDLSGCSTTETGPGGIYDVTVISGTYTISALIPTGYEASPPNVLSNTLDTKDSDGVRDGNGFSIATAVKVTADVDTNVDFGFHGSAAPNPGTGTPGYWKNHPEAWPVDDSGELVTIMIGGVSYEKDDALAGLAKITKDKTTTMFSSLLSAKLNLLIGNDGSCLSGQNGAIAKADAWMADHHLGTNVLASSDAWKIGEPTHQTLDAYNNGLLCAPHRK